jgi:predicted metal-binding transcription factor (methanogenesis marker protein 9)
MHNLKLSKLLAAVVVSFTPLSALASDEASPPALPGCSTPIGTLAIKPVACDARSCNHQQARPHFGPGIGAFAMKALDKKKLSVTPEAMARSKDDFSQMLKEAYTRTGCFTSVVTTADAAQGDYTVNARITTLDISSKRGKQRVELGVDIGLVAGGHEPGEKLSIESSSEKAAASYRHHAQILHKSEEATALDMALSDAAIRTVIETTNRMKTAPKGMSPTASATGVPQ